LEQNPDKIEWMELSRNPNAMHILEANINKINWKWLSTNPRAIELLKANHDKIDWDFIALNPSIFEVDIKQYKINITEKTNITDNLLYKN
jgi:hypothetical protein